MKIPNSSSLPVSSGNPCPFLRALVADGKLADDVEPIGNLARVIAKVAKAGEGAPVLPAAAIYGIAMVANGYGPLSVLRSTTEGVQLNALRNGPLDKKGAGSRILDAAGKVDAKQLVRLSEFASLKTSTNGQSEGQSEPGLDLAEITRFMDANFERAKQANGQRRLIDRALMNGEFPILLKVMGKDGPNGRYLSVADVHALFVGRRLPQRMTGQR